MCKLLDDQKTYDYIRMLKPYVYKEHKIFDIEMEIHAEEMRQHLEANHITDSRRNDECIKWAMTYGAGFRDYLETMKIFIMKYGWWTRSRQMYSKKIKELKGVVI